MELNKIKNLLSDLSKQIYLVGGAVRDYFLAKELVDIDLAVQGPTKKIAQELAARVEGSLVTLDEERAMYRIVTEEVTYDLSPLAKNEIKFDLAQRDFTINALALDLSKLESPQEDLIDPYNGLTDLEEGKLRIVSKKSFIDDPLRILRMVRFKAQFGFDIVTTTKELAQKWAAKISAVANERIKDELLKICSYKGSARNLALLAKLGIFSSLLPQADKLTEMGRCQYHQEDIWTHSIAAVEEVENLLTNSYWQTKIDKVN